MKCSEIYLQNVRVVNLVTKSTEGMMAHIQRAALTC